LFFFSSRRRHTRFSRDWSSDVCSSDLMGAGDPAPGLHFAPGEASEAGRHRVLVEAVDDTLRERLAAAEGEVATAAALVEESRAEIGRASCRERVWMSGVARSGRLDGTA